MATPNFFIVGAPKAGTDALYYALDQHPEIYMSPLKEPCYFSNEIRLKNFHPALQPQVEVSLASLRQYLDEGMLYKRFGGIISEWSDYLKLFSGVTHEKAIGEGSVCYLWSESAPAAIASAIPHARILIILMDPAERAFYQYLKSVSDGTVGHSFREHLKLAMQADSRLGVYNPFLAFGNYTEQVRRYQENFPHHQLSISLYEDTHAGYAVWFSNLLSFLGVDSSFVPQEVEVPSTPHVPKFVGISHALRLHKLKRVAGSMVPRSLRSYARHLVYRDKDMPQLHPEDRVTLVRHYREDILKLQDLIQRDLTAWLR